YPRTMDHIGIAHHEVNRYRNVQVPKMPRMTSRAISVANPEMIHQIISPLLRRILAITRRTAFDEDMRELNHTTQYWFASRSIRSLACLLDSFATLPAPPIFVFTIPCRPTSHYSEMTKAGVWRIS